MDQPDEEAVSPEPPPYPVKTPERMRREEMFLWPWRVLILAAAVWAGVYGVIGMVAPVERLEYLAEETIHGALQLGVTMFLAMELLYYLYISAVFRGCREWGMIVWLLGAVAVAVNLKFGL